MSIRFVSICFVSMHLVSIRFVNMHLEKVMGLKANLDNFAWTAGFATPRQLSQSKVDNCILFISQRAHLKTILLITLIYSSCSCFAFHSFLQEFW
jgi:hypothetical protein